MIKSFIKHKSVKKRYKKSQKCHKVPKTALFVDQDLDDVDDDEDGDDDEEDEEEECNSWYR